MNFKLIYDYIENIFCALMYINAFNSKLNRTSIIIFFIFDFLEMKMGSGNMINEEERRSSSFLLWDKIKYKTEQKEIYSRFVCCVVLGYRDFLIIIMITEIMPYRVCIYLQLRFFCFF